MSIRSNKARADRLVREYLAARSARREHGARAKSIFLGRLSSPGGLALCFGAGAVAGLRLGRTDPSGAERYDGMPEDGQEKGAFQRFSESPVGNIALRLAAATIVRYVLAGGGDEGAGEAGQPPTPEMATGEP